MKMLQHRRRLLIDAKNAAKSSEDLGSVTAGDPFALSDDQNDLLKKNAILGEEVRLQKQLLKAKRDNNEAGILQAKREIAALPMRLKLTNLTDDLVKSEEAYTDMTKQSADATETLIEKNLRLNESMEEVKDQLKGLEDIFEEIHPMYEEQINAVHGLSNGFSEALADMVVSGKFNLRSLMDVFRSFVRTMVAKALELFVVNTILSRIFPSAFTPLPTGGFVQKRFSATGGAVYGKQPVVVGERGAEIFVPHSAGTIMNSNNTRSAMSGGGGGATVVQNINISTGVQQTVRTEIRSMMPEIARSASSAVADSKRRGGSFGRAFA